MVERIAAGGMGVVYRAEHIGLERKVAVKFLHQSVIADKELRRRFEVEAKAASRVAHPNCLGVIDFGVDRRVPYLVMDYVEGLTLRGGAHAASSASHARSTWAPRCWPGWGTRTSTAS